MRPPRASSGGKMARLKRTTYSSPTPKERLTNSLLSYYHHAPKIREGQIGKEMKTAKESGI
jgi:hypothetical protein